MKKFVILLTCTLICAFLLLNCAHARPQKPGPNFVWIAPHKKQNGVLIRGHWKYTGPQRKTKHWVPGHYSVNGLWVQGHWKHHKVRNPGAVWVPGHHGPKGRWIPGHWR